MARNTEIYTFNKENARENLLPFMSNTIFHQKSFAQFLNDRRNEFGDQFNISENRIAKIISTDINYIQPEELLEIMFFLNEEITYNKNVSEKNIESYGINLLYELPTKTVCYSYMHQYSNYTTYYPIEEMMDADYCGYNISAEDFLRFNDYMILLTKKILDSGIDGHQYAEEYFTDLEKKAFEVINNKFAGEKELHKIIEEEFLYLKDSVDNENNDGATQIVWYASEFLSKSVEMLENINLQDRVVILDY
ncbi:MAG: hypothetical protein LBE92_14765 [Chryseobacterium sp.]|jgi:hypothetical protein|uniref:hypothetical protein n=1 Tax=Chryseobacterium sp. TaxID=1871047 RepID=UPI002824377B|nr:hypothetical protein [Chryseobacterium sp.]MDR2237383.1 hypothetical protein [Chryseobacterium sp.]